MEEKPLDQGPPAGLSATDEAFDFSGLETKILKATEHLSHELSQLRAGGRFNPELVENLQVQLDKDSSQKVKLKDIAQVVPKGRFVHIILSEEAVRNPHGRAQLMSADVNAFSSSTSRPLGQPSVHRSIQLLLKAQRRKHQRH